MSKYKIICVNLLRRPDRKENTIKLFEKYKISRYEFFEAVDGYQLEATLQIKDLFLGNDFGYRKGFIGCALSHLKLWENLVKDPVHNAYVIFEDDVTKLHDDYVRMLSNITLICGDLVFLGYHAKIPYAGGFYQLAPLDRDNFIGGTFNYIVTKQGAQKLLEYALQNHVKHGIDYFMKIVPSLYTQEMRPSIAFSDWVQSSNSTVDSDIQKSGDCFMFIEQKSDRSESEADELQDLIEQFIYYPNVDYSGCDIKCVGRKEPLDIMKIV